MEGIYNGLPLFQINITDETDFEAVSIVTEPAIQEYFLAMSDEDNIRFSKIDEDKHIVTGPVLIPDQKILRKTDKGDYFYITFSKDMVEKYALRFFEENSNTTGNIEHELFVNGVVFFESYLINRDRGICPTEYSKLPDGTWCMSAKINNEDVWKLVKDGTLKGFSVQINKIKVEDVEMKAEKVEKTIETIEELFDIIIKK